MPQVSSKAFKPEPVASTALLAVTTTSSGVQVHSGFASHIRVYNSGSVAAYIEFGKSSATATVPAAGTPGSMVVAPGTIEIFGCNEGYVAAITGSGTTDLYITPGFGS